MQNSFKELFTEGNVEYVSFEISDPDNIKGGFKSETDAKKAWTKYVDYGDVKVMTKKEYDKEYKK
jgi:hypothetical protein